ncbi:alaserpin-like, partial [Copidosoma floridanum]|uniref:alaserpin-like n=1 Tax=Copidosoma floridanum TaxID=29053 RepID=UPI000C6F553F
MAEKIDEAVLSVTKGAEGFTTDFHKSLAGKNKGNFVSSGLSAHTVLSMAAYGADGSSAQEMRKTLHLPVNDSHKVDKVTLEVANRIYIAKNMKVREEFKRLAIDPFRTEAAEMDVTSPKETVKMINDWVAEKTHQKIKDLMQEDDIRADTRMTLLNAIYFKANWYTAFNQKDTRDETFHLGETSEVKVPMMQVTVNTYHGELPRMKAKFIELPYENENVVMIVILPDEVSGLSEIEKHLHSLYPKTLSEARDFKEVQVSLPKFKIESTVDLKRVVQRLGMTDMFTDRANFTGIALEPLKVDKVVQKAFIEVNEKGSEAAAATSKFTGTQID